MDLESDLRAKSSFTTDEAKKHGLSPRMLSYYVSKGQIERLSRGVYRFSDYMIKDANLQWEELSVAAQRIPGAVICLISALNYYGLTVERTIVDSFRLLDFETAMKALKLYLQGKCGRPNIKKLNLYSKELRAGVNKYLAPLLV